MKRLAIILAFSATILLYGCGGGMSAAKKSSTITTTDTTQVPNIAGNWQFTTSSAGAGMSSVTGAKMRFLTIAGSIDQAESAVSGALHVDSSNCFDSLTTLGLQGNVTAGNTSLSFTAVDGQVLTMTGTFTDTSFVGTYRINGGCANGQQGKITGNNVPYVGNQFSGTFTNSAHETFNLTGDITQSANASSVGSFAMDGSATFDSPCFKSGTLKPGTFPSGSYILGTSVRLEYETGNGTLAFVGTVNQDGSELSGNYSISGGSCDGEGTAVLLVSSPWDY